MMKVVAFQVKTMRIQILKARGPGKFCSRRTTWPKVLEMITVFENCSLARGFVRQKATLEIFVRGDCVSDSGDA